MKTIALSVLSDAVNGWVLRTPGRKYPGIVVQGDALQQLNNLASELVRLSDQTDNEELKDVAVELRDLLAGRLAHYDAVLRQSGYATPP